MREKESEIVQYFLRAESVKWSRVACLNSISYERNIHIHISYNAMAHQTPETQRAPSRSFSSSTLSYMMFLS